MGKLYVFLSGISSPSKNVKSNLPQSILISFLVWISVYNINTEGKCLTCTL